MIVDVHFQPLPPPNENALKIEIGIKGTLGWEHSTAEVPTPGHPTAPTFTESGAVLVWAQVEGKIPITGVFFLLLGAQIQAGAKFLISEKAELPEGSHEEVVPPHKPSLVFDLEVKAYVGVGMKAGPVEGSLAIGVAIVIEGEVVKVGPLVLLQAEVKLVIVAVEVSGEFKGLFFEEAGNTMCEWGGTVEINVEIFFIGIRASLEITDTSEV